MVENKILLAPTKPGFEPLDVQMKANVNLTVPSIVCHFMYFQCLMITKLVRFEKTSTKRRPIQFSL